MRLTVRLIGHLLDDLPNGGSDFDGENLEVGTSSTIPQLALRIGLGPDAEFFVMVNESHLPNERWPEHQLADGDEVVFCPPLKGG